MVPFSECDRIIPRHGLCGPKARVTAITKDDLKNGPNAHGGRPQESAHRDAGHNTEPLRNIGRDTHRKCMLKDNFFLAHSFTAELANSSVSFRDKVWI